MSAFAPLAGVNRTSLKQAETDAADPNRPSPP
jgi:DNA-binding XRE family transcriptional regulator